ncbi:MULTISPECIES: SEC-C metal-binding domain-containing protein [unclassified Geobacillus]|uniref:SEC-C metal-binding domain-containing protein n=1 Tax=unclassified Geobacillus TaxID=2642459 RepID=UPI0018EE73DC|nr:MULTISPECIES: SEC-C metal-binding domain-containing protein [unclassified Geobacillus]
MAFLQKIEPYVVSGDPIVQQFVLQALEEYPHVPNEWTERLIEKAVRSHGKHREILWDLRNHSLSERALLLLIEGLKREKAGEARPYFNLLDNVEPALAIKYKAELKPYISNGTWELYELLLHGTKEEVWREYERMLALLEGNVSYNDLQFRRTKKIAAALVRNGWMTEAEIDDILQAEKEEWFSFAGVFAVYAAGRLKLEKHIPLLASLLVKDDDILLEEVVSALLGFQSDAVVKAVAPYVEKQESVIFAISVLANTKSTLAVDVLKNAYRREMDDDIKSLLFEALCQQLSEEALPEINEYMEKRRNAAMIDTELIAYGFYRVMGIEHPNLEKWGQIALEKEKRYEQLQHQLPLKVPYRNVNKIGRNDPCPCGSGKKYKKCCGA